MTICAVAAVGTLLTGCASVEAAGDHSSSAAQQSRCNVRLQTGIASSGTSSSAEVRQQSQLDRVAAIAALNQLEMRMPAQQRTGDSLLERLVRDCS